MIWFVMAMKKLQKKQHRGEQMKEIWKDIKDYEGLYQVSNLGRVKSLPRKRITPTKGIYYSAEKILKPDETGHGYLQVTLCRDSKLKMPYT